MMLFIIGTLTGGCTIWLFYARKRQKIKLLEEEKQLLRQEKQIVVEFMHNMVEAVTESSDRTAMFQRIIHAAILSTGAMSACIFEKLENNTLKGVAVEGLFPPQRKLPESNLEKNHTRSQFLEKILKSETFHMGEGLIGQVAQSRQATLIANAQNDPRVIKHKDPSLEIRSIIAAPVIFQDNLIAVLAVANPSDGMAFNETDYSLVESLAEQVGLTVHNREAIQLKIDKNKLELDIELASNIQSLLLPKQYPPADHIAFASHYTPAQKIGGDLYDVFALDKKTIAFAIADVSGKGVSASILMAICQTHLRHFAKQHRSPSKVLSLINGAMEKTMRQDMFITMVYAIIDLETEQLTLARAGHELPIFYDQHCVGTFDIGSIQSPGMAIGIVTSDIFEGIIEDTSIHFGSKDVLILYTDGLTESLSLQGEEYGTQRLIKLLHTHGHKDAQLIIDLILEDVGNYSKGTDELLDDLTLIAVKHA